MRVVHRFHWWPRLLRISLAAASAVILTVSDADVANAATTGNITGVVTSETDRVPGAGLRVAAVSPSARYTTVTDGKGFFSLTGVTPDTYDISVDVQGFQPAIVRGITVVPDQTSVANLSLLRALRTIGRSSARSVGSAYQPQQVTDTYTVSQSQITNLLGRQGGTSEAQVVGQLPGATFDSSGFPVIRGGRENEEGFQFEGIDYTDALTSQFVNNLRLNGISTLQLTPGAGDASSGNSGTGTLNLTLKRGTYPPGGQIEVDARTPTYAHYLRFEYGIASPGGRLSNYVSFVGERNAGQYGYPGSNVFDVSTGAPFTGTTLYAANDFVDNLVYKFGRDNDQSLQFVYQNEAVNFYLSNGGFEQFSFKTNDPYWLSQAEAFSGLNKAQIQQIVPLYQFQTSVDQRLNRPNGQVQPNETIKLQYGINPDPSTYVTAKYYRVNATGQFDDVFSASNNFFNSSFLSLQGGLRTGTALDVTKQLSAKHLLGIGGKFEFIHPVFSQQDNLASFFDLTAGTLGSEVYDFVPAGPNCPASCGYLAANGIPAGTRIPLLNEVTSTNRQDTAAYVDDTWSPNSKLRMNAGLRLDMANYQLPGYNSESYLPAAGAGYSGLYLPTSTGVYAPGTIVDGADVSGLPDPSKDRFNYDGQTRHAKVLEPRLAASYQLGSANAVRASYGRSVQFAALAFVDLSTDRRDYQQFTGIPAYNSFSGPGPVFICGPTGDRRCRDYADQLFWENQNNFAGVPIQPTKPATFSNFDFSYSHLFPAAIALKVTPFYRRGYDAPVLVASPKLTAAGSPVLDSNGAPILNPSVTTNLGINRTTGVEMLVTKDAPFGLSGQLTATYINELTNILPTQSSEDFFPTVSLASLALGNVYRVGFLSPFQVNMSPQYKSHGGLRINPILQYNIGYPLGTGNVAQTFLYGSAVNVPSTNITNSGQLSGSAGATTYVDPQNPGSILHPNVAATRGTPEKSSPGGFLSPQSLTANLSLEYAPAKSRSTFGVLVTNLFNNVYNLPAVNPRYQPLATGLSGPLSGQTTGAVLFPTSGFANYSAERFGTSAYLINPNLTPREVRFYYVLKL